MNKPYKILAINGSHRSKNGISEIMLQKFLKGARLAGADCETVYTSKMKILPCKVCHQCIVKTPGACFQKDDMQALIDKIENSDLLVLASPVYFDTMPSDMKKMFERLMPTLGPVFEFKNGRTYHKTTSSKKQQVVSILLCGNPERECLDSIKGTFQRIFNNTGGQILGEFLFTSSSLAVSHPELLANQFEALTEAGKEVVSLNKINSETIKEANTEYIADYEADITQKNKMFKELREQNGLL